jgi:hypothetical protein
MGTYNSAYYYAKIVEIEDKIADEINLSGVRIAENGDDKLEFDKRLKSLMDLKAYYENEYNSALVKEGKELTQINFLGRYEMGN